MNFDEFLKNESLKSAVDDAIKSAGDFPKLNDDADLSHYIQQVAFNVTLEVVHSYHEWLTPQLER